MMQKAVFHKRIFVLLLALLLCACAAPERDAAVPDTPAAPPETPVDDTVSVLTPEPTPDSTPIPTPTPVPTPEPPFMIVWASDTQEMIAHERMRPAFRAMCDWIVNEAETKNIAAFLHTGDMVDNGDVAGQWNLFNEGIAEIEEKVPFFWAAGNHDAGFSGNAPWKQQPYVKALPKEQKYNNGDAAYMILNAGSTQLLFLSVAYYREKTKTRSPGSRRSARRIRISLPF
ncbi:MAG: metallophosphoesterase [Clostridia bacterium]|nr:metallophosphoesterase [Clostridia bacterium]